ncbi:dihydrofolate reductase family protein [Streptomyces sp. NPDC001750]|uniref:dihydrofolate reductase family protein n=1 Tax=Streptomyces sp. NPDC001750 TaxID=3364607 RepID=UPI003675F3D3
MARAKELAGEKDVVANGGQMARQCLEAGLLDEVGIALVPVVLGGGKKLFGELGTAPVQFDGPTAVVDGTGVTHLRYRVRK